MNVVEVTATPCPVCSASLDRAATAEKGVTPKPGDLSMCGECGSVLILDEHTNPRRPDLNELMDFQKEEPALWRDLCRAQYVVEERERRELDAWYNDKQITVKK